MTNLQKGIKIGAIAFGIFLIVNIISGICLSLSLVTSILGNDKNETNNSFTEISVLNDTDLEKVINLNLDVSFLESEIKSGEKFKIEYSGSDKISVKTKVNGSTLEIKDSSLNVFKNKTGKVTITVPNHVKFSEIYVNNGAGKISMQSLTANKLDIDQGAGLLSMKDCYFNSSDIDGGAGKIVVFDSNLGVVDLDAGVGEVTISATIDDQSKIDAGVGALNLELFGGEEAYRLYIEKGVGSIRVNGQNYKDDVSYGTGSKTIDISSGIGSINIDFK